MPRGYRYVLVAAFGWIALAAATQADKGNAPGKDSQATKELRDASAAIVAAIRKTDKPAEKDRGCKPRKDDRSSDLCAQWEAVDAARNAAKYSLWSLLVGGVGTTLLIWTLAETRSNARRQLRAYLSVELLELDKWAIGQIPVLAIKIKNGGATPAYKMRFWGLLFVEKHPLPLDPAKYIVLDDKGEMPNYTVQIGQEQEGEISFTRELSVTDYMPMQSGNSMLYGVVNIVYEDTFGVERVTRLSAFTGGPTFFAADAKARADGLVRTHSDWTVTRLHNDAS